MKDKGSRMKDTSDLPDSSYILHPSSFADQRAALELALARRPALVQHHLQLLQNGLLDPRGIFVAQKDNQIVGVQVCVPLAGATCLFWLPATTDSIADQLVHEGLTWVRSLRCKLAQALAHPDELRWAEPLKRCGFSAVTHLLQLERSLDDVPAAPAILRYETYRPSLHADFAATLERTYEGTLDCPELNGKRTADEILAGHRGQGIFHPECWLLAYDGASPVGLILLTEMADGVTWELAYIGIVPEHRRRGLGRVLTLHALNLLRDQPATRLILCVDERNRPARRLYQSLGFAEGESSEVLLHFLQ
jgi:ribosomal protein S18 acetylase RimI-like enzyme